MEFTQNIIHKIALSKLVKISSLWKSYEKNKNKQKYQQNITQHIWEKGKIFDFRTKIGTIWAILSEQEFFEKLGFAQSLTLIKT